jgi:molybdenum-dependent DNA-binding transcriptional regulator ModE
MSIKYEDIMVAISKAGSVAGAAKLVGLTPRTFTRLKEMYENGLIKK